MAGVEKITLGSETYSVELGFGAAWVQIRSPAQLVKVEQATGEVTLSVTGGVGSEVGPDAMWVSVAGLELVKIDPVSCETLLTVPAVGATYFALGLDSVWVPTENGDLLRLDEATGDLLATIETNTVLKNVAVGDDAVWATAKDNDRVLRIDPATNAVVAEIPTFDKPQDLVIDEHGVWVTHDAGAGTVTLIDPGSNTVLSTVDGVGTGTGIAAGGGYIWVSTTNIGITRIDPQTYQTTPVIELPGEANYGIAYGGDELWVTSRSGWIYRVPVPPS